MIINALFLMKYFIALILYIFLIEKSYKTKVICELPNPSTLIM